MSCYDVNQKQQQIYCCADKLFLLGLKSEMTPDVSYVKLLVDYITAQALIRYLP